MIATDALTVFAQQRGNATAKLDPNIILFVVAAIAALVFLVVHVHLLQLHPTVDSVAAHRGEH